MELGLFQCKKGQCGKPLQQLNILLVKTASRLHVTQTDDAPDASVAPERNAHHAAQGIQGGIGQTVRPTLVIVDHHRSAGLPYLPAQALAIVYFAAHFAAEKAHTDPDFHLIAARRAQIDIPVPGMGQRHGPFQDGMQQRLGVQLVDQAQSGFMQRVQVLVLALDGQFGCQQFLGLPVEGLRAVARGCVGGCGIQCATSIIKETERYMDFNRSTIHLSINDIDTSAG